MNSLKSVLCSLLLAAAMTTGCATHHVSMVAGQIPELQVADIASDLLSVFAKSQHSDAETVFLHRSGKDNALEDELEKQLRSLGFVVDSNNIGSEGHLDSSASVVIAYRAEVYNEDRFASVCLLVADTVRTVCREYDLELGEAVSSISVTGVDQMVESEDEKRRRKVYEEFVSAAQKKEKRVLAPIGG